MASLPSIVFQAGALSRLPFLLPGLTEYSQLILLTHPSLKQLYGLPLLAALKSCKRPLIEIEVPEGEDSKSLTQAVECWQRLFAQGVDRHAALIALGGGVICDLAGFIASCYMRGLNLFFIPTTLLAMVDAALGGKNGVNLKNAKNAIGTFYHPHAIVIDPLCLTTLPRRELNAGLAEIIKYGIVKDFLLFEKLEARIEELTEELQSDFLEEVIQHCIKIKHDIVVQDEKDQNGQRAILNYGHTFGHAIEAVTGYQRYLHGEAVAIGMSCAASLSAQMGLCDRSLIARQDQLCHRAHLPTQCPRLPIEQMITAMQSDKKSKSGKINLILLERIGKVVKMCDVKPALIEQVLLAKMMNE